MSAVAVRGVRHASFAFEIGQAVDLDRATLLAAHLGGTVDRVQPRPAGGFGYHPPPVRIVFPGGSAWPGPIEATVFDFGAASVSLAEPFDDRFEAVVESTLALRMDDRAERMARRVLDEVTAGLHSAITRFQVADLIEDYFTIRVDRPNAGHLFPLLTGDLAAATTRLLRGNPGRPSDPEIADAISGRLALNDTTASIVDWNAAVVWDPSGDESRPILEFANLQLLELRHLDRQLDAALDRAYEALSQSTRRLPTIRSPIRALTGLIELQVDSALLFERVTNASKLVGDQYASRLYRLISSRLRLTDWDQAIARKLQAMDGIYGKVSDRSTARRLEILEWIVIILIASEIVISMVRAG